MEREAHRPSHFARHADPTEPRDEGVPGACTAHEGVHNDSSRSQLRFQCACSSGHVLKEFSTKFTKEHGRRPKPEDVKRSSELGLMPAYIRYRKLKAVRRESTSFACVAFSFTMCHGWRYMGEHGSGVKLVAGGGAEA